MFQEKTYITIATIASTILIISYLTGFIKYLWIKTLEFLNKDNFNCPKKTISIIDYESSKETHWQMLNIDSSDQTMLITGTFTVTNISQVPFRPITSKLKMPFSFQKKYMHGLAMIKEQNGNTYGSYLNSGYELDMGQTTKLNIMFQIFPPYKAVGEDFYADISIVDQYGNDHWIKNVFIPSIN